MRCIIAELGDDIVAGPKTVLKGLGSQVFARHNKPAIQADDDQGEQEPAPKEPTSSKLPTPKKQKSTKPSKPKKTTQGDEMPKAVNVQSALQTKPTETSSQLPATSQPTKHVKHTKKAKTAHSSKGDTTTELKTSEPIHSTFPTL